jgi:nitrite reductase/ring-hydroxylating ferredoxin subunit
MSLAELREGVLNVKVLRSGRKAIILRKGSELRAFGELCPHMGADMSEATYCSRTGTLRCRWHGYVFSAEDGKLLENPNEKLMRIARTPSQHFDPTKTPRYRLANVRLSVKGGQVLFGREEESGSRASTAEGGAL